jgi:hypothetical protein
MNINHQSCPPSYKLSNDLSKISGLHSIINIKKDMLVELCVGNYATSNGLLNGVDGIFKTSTTYYEKTIMIYIIIITTTLNQNGHQFNISSKI